MGSGLLGPPQEAKIGPFTGQSRAQHPPKHISGIPPCSGRLGSDPTFIRTGLAIMLGLAPVSKLQKTTGPS